MVDYIVAYMEVIETHPLQAEDGHPLPPANSPMHFEVSKCVQDKENTPN